MIKSIDPRNSYLTKVKQTVGDKLWGGKCEVCDRQKGQYGWNLLNKEERHIRRGPSGMQNLLWQYKPLQEFHEADQREWTL